MNESNKTQSAPGSAPEYALTDRLAQAEKERGELLVALRVFAEAYEPIAEQDKRWVNMTEAERAALDGNRMTPPMTIGDFRRAYEAVQGIRTPAANAAGLSCAAALAPEGGRDAFAAAFRELDCSTPDGVIDIAWAGIPGKLWCAAQRRTPAADAAGLRDLCAEMVKLHSERGTVLMVHMDEMARILSDRAPAVGAGGLDATGSDK